MRKAQNILDMYEIELVELETYIDSLNSEYDRVLSVNVSDSYNVELD